MAPGLDPAMTSDTRPGRADRSDRIAPASASDATPWATQITSAITRLQDLAPG
jgi:hypothetical protein